MKRIILCLAIALFLVSCVSADLGTFPKGSCVDIKAPLNTTSVNITISYPNSTTIVNNLAMTKVGNMFNYTFCNTSTFGQYTYGFIEADGTPHSNSFTINGSGQNVSSQQVTLILIGFGMLLVVIVFFFVFSNMVKHPGVKIFLMSLSVLSLVMLIGLVSSQANIYLAEFPSLVTIYNAYYIIFATLAGVAMLGVVVWLIAYSLKLFNKTRGLVEDGD